MQQEILQYLLSIGFHKVRATQIMRLERALDNEKDPYEINMLTMRLEGAEIDFNRFDCCIRLHEIHYLFYSTHFKHFTISVMYERPKGIIGAGHKGMVETFNHISIPKVINSIEDAELLLLGLGVIVNKKAGV